MGGLKRRSSRILNFDRVVLCRISSFGGTNEWMTLKLLNSGTASVSNEVNFGVELEPRTGGLEEIRRDSRAVWQWLSRACSCVGGCRGEWNVYGSWRK